MRYKELADAIRRGAKMRPQGFGGVKKQIALGTSCALLSAYEAIEGYPGAEFCSRYLMLWAAKQFPNLPLSEVIARNDSVGQNREQIADWLDSLKEPGESDSDWAKRRVAEVTRVKEVV